MSQGISILGATGSIGRNTLDVIARNPKRFTLIAASANTNVGRMAEICKRFKPEIAAMADEKSALKLGSLIDPASTEVLSGQEGLIAVANKDSANQVMAAIVGSAGLIPTLAAVKAGKRVLLANKEALIMGGRLFMEEITANNAELLPVDSEHNAIFQSMPQGYKIGVKPLGVKKIILTASGGPFLADEISTLQHKTPEEAVAHPNWDMGAKISVDSATMMNKGLEWIEACLLFNMNMDEVEITVHPQSIVHSMVEYYDGSMIAQLGRADMRVPIANVMGFPARIDSGVAGIDFSSGLKLEFSQACEHRFPCLKLAREAYAAGEVKTIALNAANEIAVGLFLAKKIKFTDISVIIARTLDDIDNFTIDSINSVIMTDKAARGKACEIARNL